MDINELESFKLSDAVTFHEELNPKLWEDNTLDPAVRDQLLLIAEDFVEYLGISNLKVKDVTISGSNAAYSYTPHSDLDLHVLVDFNELPDNEVYQELFTAKKTLYNDEHDISVRDVPVELYVQDVNQPVQSLGEYSIVHDKWIRIPKKRRANFDEAATKAKYEKLGDLIELALKSKNPKQVNDAIALIKRYRKSGLDKHGEFGPENLAYKAVRTQGLVQALYDLKSQLHGEKLSIEEAASREDAILKINKLRNLKGRTPGEIENVKRIIVNLMKQWNIQPEEIGIKQKVDPLKAKIAKAAYEKTMAADKFKQEWERFKKGIFAEQETDEDYDPNGPPPGPEFKPTMPAGTVRVDVSDVYDWYKLGQHISNMKGLGKHDFGKGPPSTILSFGDEDTEHEYIQDLEKTGLTTTDIDPVDPNQPKGMKSQKTDPTFNVNETDDRTAAVLKIQKHLNKKYGANLDLDGKLGPLTLKSINKFMPRAKKGLADEPNKTTAVQGKKLKEATNKMSVKDTLAYLKKVMGTESHEDWRNDVINNNDYFVSKTIPLDSLWIDLPKLDKANVEKYKKMDFSKAPPIVVGSNGHIIDGYHRANVAKALGIPTLKAWVGVKKVTEAPRTFQSQVTPLEKLLQDYGYFISTGTVHLEKNGETPEAQQKLLELVQRLQKDAKTFVGLDKNKMESNRDTILNHIHQMMQYAIPILKKYLPADKWEAKRSQINSVLSAYNNVRQINEASGAKIDAHREGDTIWINYFEVPVRGKGLGKAEYEKFEKSLPKDIKKIRLVASDAGYGPTHDFWDRMGFDYAYPDDDNEMVKLLEASGYIPSEKEKNDPRFLMALTKDVRPDANKKNAKAFGWKVSRAGIPPQARADGKIK